MYLYIMIFPNDKKYVGITTNLKKRFYSHKSKATNFKHPNEYLQNAINKYGWENIKFQVADGYENWNSLCAAEIEKISELKTTNKIFGYNISNGGIGPIGFTHTDRWKKMMSERMSGENSPSFGRKLTQKQKRHLSKINSGDKHPMYGKKKSKQAVEKTRAGLLKFYEVHYSSFAGKSHSKSAKTKISKANSGKNNGMYGKISPNAKLNLYIANEIRNKYKSGKYAYIQLAKEYNVSQTTISDIIKNRKYKND